MKVPVRRFDTTLPLPEYKTSGAVALDLAARETVTIPARSIGYAPLNVAIHPPAGHFVLLAARSSLHKRGLMFANGIGVIDEDYCGDGDEYQAILYNFTNESVTIEKGDRIAQVIFVPYSKIEWDERESLGNPTRGGIGSTGTSDTVGE